MSLVTLVLGASLKPHRYSNLAIRKLRAKGFDVVAIGKREGLIGDVHIVTNKEFFKQIDTVTVYLNSENQQEYYKYIIKLCPRRVIFNPGAENKEFVELLSENNIGTEIACTLVLLNLNQYDA